MNLNNEMKLWQYFFLLLYVFDAAFVDATKVTPPSSVTSKSPTEYSSSLQWQCDNGEFIQTDQLCDGGPHCSDASDETAEHCIHIFCPQYAFRCAYGACITGTSKCDNHQDCIDNSDENRFLCGGNVHELERQLIGTCNGPGSMQCKSGECISIEKRCDGLKDCHDESDETVELCSYMYCPKYAFRCGYGGCIRGSAKCDGFADCVDGSDEAAELCRFERRKPGDKKPEPKPVSRPSSGCLIPFNRRALLAMHGHNGTLLRLGIRVPVGSQITFACEERNCALEGYQQNSCLEMDTWQFPVPFCAKYCAHTTLTKGISTSVSCTHEHKSVNCSAQLRVGTTAQVRCAPGYELPRNRPNIVDKLTCDADGEWDYPKFKCKPQCGMMLGKVMNTTAIIERPWHVTIYSRVFDGTLLSVCGGAIIAPNLVITGAECFADDMNRLQNEPIFYSLMLGHHLRELSAGEYRLKQLHNISQILLSDNDSLEPNDDYKHGVALLVLVNHIDFAQSAKPICLNFEKSVVHSEPHQQLMLSPQQQLELGYINKGYAFAVANGRRATLTGIVEEFNEESGAVAIINVNHYKKFIKKIIRRYKYIL